MDPFLRLQSLFEKYLLRQCTAAELEEMISLLQQTGSAESLEASMREIWEKCKKQDPAEPGAGLFPAVDWEKMYETVSHTGQGHLHRRTAKEELRRRNRSGFFFMNRRIAAALFLLLPLSFFLLYKWGRRDPAPVLPGPEAAKAVVAKGRMRSERRQTIHLPDGSTVVLNERSKLDFPSRFTGRFREVVLTGEAWFDIRQETGRPFLVHTGRITTRVLGTSFDVKAYASDKAVAVTVTSGKVQVLREDTKLGQLTANQQLRVSMETGAFKTIPVDARAVVAWKPAEIVLNDISMREAAGELEKRFGLTIGFANAAIKDCRVTATFSSDDSPEEILTVLCGVSQSSYSIQNDKIMIDGKGCN